MWVPIPGERGRKGCRLYTAKYHTRVKGSMLAIPTAVGDPYQQC